MRTIRQLVEGLLRIRALRSSSRDEEALDAVGELLASTLQLQPSLVYAVSPETLRSLLSPAGTPDLERMVVAGRLLKERAELLSQLGRGEEAVWHAAQALVLLEEAQRVDVERHLEAHYAGIEALQQLVDASPPATER